MALEQRETSNTPVVVDQRSPTVANATADETRPRVMSRRTRSRVSEALLAYGLLLPALVIIFTFGLFPLAFSLYQSTLVGLNQIVGRYDGLGNYVKAIDNLAYVLAFWIAIVLIFLAARQIKQIWTESRKQAEQPLYWLPAGALVGGGMALVAVFVFTLLPHMLRIPAQVPRGQAITPDLFRQLLGEAWRMEDVQSALMAVVVVSIAAAVVSYLTHRFAPHQSGRSDYFSGFLQVTIYTISAVVLSYVTWTEIQKAYATALENGESLAIWSQVVTISAGIVLLLLSYFVWRGSSQAGSTPRLLLRMGAALALAIGAWVLIAELPEAIAAGDKRWWQSLLATVYFALFTIPLQFTFALALASILFLNLRGQTAFRMIFFLPYIAPLVGTAAAFRIIFSGRANAPVNAFLANFGIDPLGWLNDPTGIFQMLIGDAVTLPTWLAGPSLALMTIVIYNVWTYVGFDIVIFLAGLGSIPKELYEAASIDGSNRWGQFRFITLPLLSPTIYFLMLLAVIGTFKAFTRIYVMRTGAALGTTDTASVLIFQTFNRDTRYGYASALAILLLLIVIVLTVVNNRVSKDRVFYG